MSEYPEPNDEVTDEEIIAHVKEFESMDETSNPDENAPKPRMPVEDWE